MSEYFREKISLKADDVRPEEVPVVLPQFVQLAKETALRVLMEPLLLRQLTIELPKLAAMQVTLQSNGTAIQALPGVSQVPLLERKDNG